MISRVFSDPQYESRLVAEQIQKRQEASQRVTRSPSYREDCECPTCRVHRHRLATNA